MLELKQERIILDLYLHQVSRRVSFEKAHELAQLIPPTVKIVGHLSNQV